MHQVHYEVASCTLCCTADLLLPLHCCSGCDACPRDWNPYCIATGGWGPRTFANCCFAKCNNVKILSQVLHAGACSGACTEKCDPKLEKPLCCGGKTYKNGCFALCLGQDTNQCSAGRCSSGEMDVNGSSSLACLCLCAPLTLMCSICSIVTYALACIVLQCSQLMGCLELLTQHRAGLLHQAW